MAFSLWPFQREVCRDAQLALRSHKAICIVLPTGSGKTGISGAISQRLVKELGERQGGIALYLVHRTELLRQTVETLKAFGLGDMIGVIAAGQPGAPWAPLQVASIPTLRNRLDVVTQWHKPAVVFIDEAHHVAANTWNKVYEAFPDAYKIGMTATPIRLDGKGLGAYFSELIIGPQISDLVPKYLAPSICFHVHPKYDLKELARRRFSRKAVGDVQTGPVIADTISSWQRHAGDRRTIFFCANVDHSKRTAERLRGIGVAAEHVDYKTPKHVRENTLAAYEAGRIQCLTNVELFTEGMDAPATNCIVHARATDSFTHWRQANGRGMRRKSDGGDNLVLDLCGNIRHGDPDADVHWELEHGIGVDERKAIASNVRACEACNFVYEKKYIRCPLCGMAPPKKEVEEFELELVESQGRPAPKPTKRQLSNEILATKGNIFKLKRLAKRYGYGESWAYKMKNLYGFVERA